jgi:hypothetical protein
LSLVGEIAERASGVVASAVGGTAGPFVTALLVSAAAATNNPDLALMSLPAGALTGAFTEQSVPIAMHKLRNAAERIARFVDAVAEAAGRPAEEFIDEHVTDANGREFLGRVVDAATAARSDWKTRVLARAFVRGATDGDRVDETEMFIAVTRDLEPTHARFLAAVDKLFRSDTVRLGTTVERLAEVDQGVGPSAALLWRYLRDRGLMTQVEPASKADGRDDFFRPTDLGRAVADWLVGLDAGPEPSDDRT